MSVRIETNREIATIVLHRPERRNAVDRATAFALADAFRAIEADPEVRVGVLWGAGGTFCAGADLHAVASGEANRLEPDGDGPMGPSRMVSTKPMIAAIEGYAVAGGLELALLCDLRVGASDAKLGVFCRRFGVPLIDGGAIRLPRIVGMGHALDLILTGREIGAAEAKDWGLADRLAPTGGALAVAKAVAAEIARFPSACMRADRSVALDQWSLPHGEAFAREWRSAGAFRAEGAAGAARFSAGKGRGGDFSDI